MPDTADHRVRCHQLAQARIDAGRPSWEATLDVADVFHDDALSLEVKRDAIVARIRRLPQFVAAQDVADHHVGSDDYFAAEDLIVLVEELAGVDDVPYFDHVWSAFYDWADIARVWVKTS